MVRAVEAVYREFLRTRKTLDSKKAPIARSSFYNSKVAGVWNLINTEIWNNVAILKLLSALAFKTYKMWVKWINAYYLRRNDIYNCC